MSANPYAPPTVDPSAYDRTAEGALEELRQVSYPLCFRFKLLAIASQFFFEDSNGSTLLYVRQKLLKLRENIEIFADAKRKHRVATIRANKMIDWSARYEFADETGRVFGAVGRKGFRSLWKAHYETFVASQAVPAFAIREENPWAKVCDSFLGEIPLLGLLSGYLFHPRYAATRADGTVVMRMTKQAAFFEGKFATEKLAELSPEEEQALLFSFFMLTLLERRRG